MSYLISNGSCSRSDLILDRSCFRSDFIPDEYCSRSNLIPNESCSRSNLIPDSLMGLAPGRTSFLTEMLKADVLTPKLFIGLIVDATLPYWFSTITMKIVGSTALKMVEKVRRQFNTIYILMEASALEHARAFGLKGSEPHKVAVIGYNIGDPFKDTPSLSPSILIKLMAV
ncbi:H(+)-exporting diphosphatase [Abeliophyllum distichum]|uniref:H(+)-exporting diphosphatase n=1 Tax=Abeliophyllum distichum TaxID=126358 RepID=A0ABD1VYW1_9LAMI